jgi:hypothetical protein
VANSADCHSQTIQILCDIPTKMWGMTPHAGNQVHRGMFSKKAGSSFCKNPEQMYLSDGVGRCNYLYMAHSQFNDIMICMLTHNLTTLFAS